MLWGFILRGVWGVKATSCGVVGCYETESRECMLNEGLSVSRAERNALHLDNHDDLYPCHLLQMQPDDSKISIHK
jgi:hypothetical protein